ncbi:MAG TPA: ATP-binding protein [Kofleriaceae bacterium]|nr:ATP-binding protein [Kofleriaceae bacterium]
MASASALVELGDRYWALGLPAAARSALARALAASDDAIAALRLTDIALAQGDAPAARGYAAEAARRAPGPATRILLGRAQLAAGEIAAARMALAAALDAPRLAPWDRARAHLELARAADGQGDGAGAAAQLGAAFEAAIAAAPGGIELELIEEIAAAAVAHGRGDDAGATLDAARGKPGIAAVAAVLYGARQAAGDAAITDTMVDDELAAAEAEAGRATAALRLRRLERRARRGRGGHAERAELAAELDALAHDAAGEQLAAVERARLCFLRAALCEDDPATRDRAEDAYRKGLAFQPGHTAAACRLALLVLERGDQAGALAEIERALRIDASSGGAWRNAARMLDAQSPSLGAVVSRLLDAANPGAGAAAAGVAPRLVTATAEVARHDVLAGVYAHGHRVKNLLGIIGARARSAKKLVAEGDLHDRLRELERDVTALYEEWALYLRSLQAPTPTIELVPLSPLLHEVVVAAQARTQHVSIALEQPAGLPDVRGDRMLLREALLNVVSNAAEACSAAGGEVAVRVRQIPPPGASGSPLVEIEIVDTGPGIPRAHLGRLFVPGFTTKETGSGVGLAIAERVVAAHHGRIAVDSEEGRGTTITITLPTDKHGLAALPRWTRAEGTLP